MRETTNGILARNFSDEFIWLMKNRMVASHYKYGWVDQTYPELAQAVKSIPTRLERYLETGNREWLVDIANFAMIEFMCPSHPNAHFRGTDSSESPGLTGGISINELMREMEQRGD